MATGLAALKLLIIDDNAQMRTILGTVLGGAGVRDLHYAPDGRKGLESLVRSRPDVVFVDYEMPVLNGLGFLREARRLPGEERFTPVIMLTGHSDLLRLNAARDLGVNEFLAKPVTARTILQRLGAVIFHPRPFVQSRDYVGPDRRRRVIPDYAGPKRRAADYQPVFEV